MFAYLVKFKSSGRFHQIFVAFLENLNFKSELSGRSLSNDHLLKAESMKFGLILMALLAKDISGL